MRYTTSHHDNYDSKSTDISTGKFYPYQRCGIAVKKNTTTAEALIGKIKAYPDEDVQDGSDGSYTLGTVEKITEVSETIGAEFDRVLRRAVELNVSDIHYDPLPDKLMVRFRIDGVLNDIIEYPPEATAKHIAHLKVAANLDITERNVPLDGRIEKTVDRHDLALRVSSLPVVYGEKIVLRILNTANQVLELDQLGFLPHELSLFSNAIEKPNGLILVCGPAGCGKTTTLYSAMNAINTRDKNIVTIEDPVEYRLPGINQSPVNTSLGATFAKTLRGVLRQDPDVILVGEIRDAETAAIAIKAALTGIHVFSTIHAMRSTAAIDRLVDLGIERRLIAVALDLSLSQALVRKICPKCKTEGSQTSLAALGGDEDDDEPFTMYYGKGCEYCRMTGYKGRVALFEPLEVDEEMAGHIINGASGAELEALAIGHGMVPLKASGLLLVKEGFITLEEVIETVMM